MAQDLPYTIVPGKIPDLFKKISDAKVPDNFSHAFLRDTLGLKSTNDRSLISVLKSLGIIDPSGKPTSRYRELKNNATKASAIADGIRSAFKPLFDSNENAQTLSPEDLKGLIAQVAGTDKDMTNRIHATLSYLIKEADFTKASGDQEESETDENADIEEDTQTFDRSILKNLKRSPKTSNGINPEFHFNIQVHLPNNGTEETYLNIFNALRESFT